MNAPSAHNAMPWQFIIVEDKDILAQIPKFQPYSNMLNYAAGAIVVCGDRSIQNNDGYLVLDCAVAAENILLEIDSLGYGAVILGMYPVKERMNALSELLKLPEHILPVSMISYGKAYEEKEPNNKYFEDRIRYNHW
jgi:nitroreductase